MIPRIVNITNKYNLGPTPIKLRVYYPSYVLSGPGTKLCKSYTDYLTYYSRDLAVKLLFDMGFEVFIHRVGFLQSHSNMAKYYIEDQEKPYELLSPYVIDEGSEDELPRLRGESHLSKFYSALVDFSELESYENLVIRVTTTRVVRGVTDTPDIEIRFKLFNKNLDLPEPDTINAVHFHAESEITDRKSLVIEFKKFLDKIKNYSLWSDDYYIGHEDVGIVGEDDIRRVQVSFDTTQFSISDNLGALKSEVNTRFYNIVTSKKYKDSLILSIDSLDETAYSDIKVTISDSMLGYRIVVNKYGASESSIEEFYIDKQTPKSESGSKFLDFNKQSELVQFKLGDLDKLNAPYGLNLSSIVGEYYLEGGLGYPDKEFLVQSLSQELGDLDYSQIDVIMNWMDPKVSLDIQKYFPDSVVLIPPVDPNIIENVSKALRVAPDQVDWLAPEMKLPGSFALLSSISREINPKAIYYVLKDPIDEDKTPSRDYDCSIVSSDYGPEIHGFTVDTRSFKYVIAMAMLGRYYSDLGLPMTQSGISDYITNGCLSIGKFLDIDMIPQLDDVLVVGSRYSALVTVLIDNTVITKITLDVEVNING